MNTLRSSLTKAVGERDAALKKIAELETTIKASSAQRSNLNTTLVNERDAAIRAKAEAEGYVKTLDAKIKKQRQQVASKSAQEIKNLNTKISQLNELIKVKDTQLSQLRLPRPTHTGKKAPLQNWEAYQQLKKLISSLRTTSQPPILVGQSPSTPPPPPPPSSTPPPPPSSTTQPPQRPRTII